MNNVFSINRKKILGAYIDAHAGESIPGDAYFFTGVFLTMLLPQLTLFVYGGAPPLMAFAACALAGSAIGVAKYRSPYAPPSCVETGTEARVPPREDSSQKLAA